ncbi:organic cation/carnitine transporter 2-like [Oryza glaberrima]|uniref:organic cation/carnitine transporter 2-like n=1 Tax=Oryza glaberrima TaxID=4538 RepID=UPI00224C4528|nr:organic cation/carnitine transporter 2-like [Oryza glaberrima]
MGFPTGALGAQARPGTQIMTTPPWPRPRRRALPAAGAHLRARLGDERCRRARGGAPRRHEWDRPTGTLVVSEWVLKCGGGGGLALISLPAASFFAGNLAGGFLLTTLADTHLGRRKMLVLSLATMSVAVMITAFSSNVWVYAALRLLCRFGRSMAGISAMVLSTELVRKWWINTVSVAGFIFFSVGFMSLPALMYTFREASWRNMYMWTSLPSLCYAVLLLESPRWLLVHDRKQEAIEALLQIASLNGGEGITMPSFTMLDTCAMEVGNGVAGGEGMFAMLRSICERRWALHRLAAITTASFSICVVYYGMPLSVGSLSSDLYLSVAYNAATELPSSVLSWLLMGRFNRRSSVVKLTAVSGLCSLTCVVIPADPEAGTGGLPLATELSSFASCATTRSSGTTASRRPPPRRRGLGRAASACAAAPGRRPEPPHASCLPLRCTLA